MEFQELYNVLQKCQDFAVIYSKSCTCCTKPMARKILFFKLVETNFQGRECSTWIINEMTYLVPIWRSQESASDIPTSPNDRKIHEFINYSCSLLPGLEIETHYSLQRNTVCWVNVGTYHASFFPSIAETSGGIWKCHVLDDIYMFAKSYCRMDDLIMTSWVFYCGSVAFRSLPPGFGQSIDYACKLTNSPFIFI